MTTAADTPKVRVRGLGQIIRDVLSGIPPEEAVRREERAEERRLADELRDDTTGGPTR